MLLQGIWILSNAKNHKICQVKFKNKIFSWGFLVLAIVGMASCDTLTRYFYKQPIYPKTAKENSGKYNFLYKMDTILFSLTVPSHYSILLINQGDVPDDLWFRPKLSQFGPLLLTSVLPRKSCLHVSLSNSIHL